ncbi:hypothetical protein FACS1894202_01050 [Clostridia bacterium]|nr:hypothetical protein FACS1894202_01050 [Clostridia bacterium]
MDTVQSKLYEKMSNEYDAFIDSLKAKTPGEIIDSSYEVTYKEEILINCESGSIGDKEAAALFALDNPLDELYRNWLHTDVSVADDIRDSILGSARQEIERQGLPEIAPIKESPAQVINGAVDVGNWVIPVTEKAYSGLIGQIIAVDKTGTDAHDTDNPGDDIHVDFTRTVYSESELSAIEANFAELYGERKPFYKLPLDDVIMASEMLVSLIGRDIEVTDERTQSYADAREQANNRLSAQFNNLEAALIARVEQNYAEFEQQMLTFGKRQIIEMAGRIAAMQDSCEYMTTSRGYSDDELRFYMQFNFPLDIVADAWQERNRDMEDMGFAMDYVAEHMEKFENDPIYVKVKPATVIAEPAAEPTPKPVKQPEKPKPAQAKPAQPPVKPKPQEKLSILSDLDASIIEAQERNAARTPQAHKKSNQKELD